MEADLTTRMEEFMAVLDQVKKYRALLSVLPDFVIIIGLVIVGWLTVSVLANLGLVFITYINPSWIPLDNTVQIIIVLIGISAALFWVSKAYGKVKVGQWRSTLKEGAPGAIKLLQELNWNNIYAEIRYAKLGFWLYGILKTAAYWLLVFFVSSLIIGDLAPVLHFNFDLTIAALFSLALVLVLSKKDFQKRFDQVGRLDTLMWELRWFDYEFRSSDFQA